MEVWVEFYVSMASIARWLVKINVPEPNAREILARVRQVIALHPAREWGGQMITVKRATEVLGEHGVAYRSWISCEESIYERSQMVDDWQAGTCVALTETVVDFLHRQGVHAEPAVAILQAVIRHSVAGVITVPRWSLVIPEALLPAWLAWNSIPPEVIDINTAPHQEVMQ